MKLVVNSKAFADCMKKIAPAVEVTKDKKGTTESSIQLMMTKRKLAKIRPAAMQVPLDTGSPLPPQQADIPSAVVETAETATDMPESSYEAKDVRSRVVLDAQNVIARGMSPRGNARSGSMLRVLQQANIEVEREIAILREEGTALTEEAIRSKRISVQEARLEAGKEKRERMEKMAEKKAEKKEQEEKIAEQREKGKTEKKTLRMQEAKIAGNDVQNLTEKLVAAKTTANHSAVSGTIGVDIKV